MIIAEAGVNHNGELEKALSLIDAAAEAGEGIDHEDATLTADRRHRLLQFRAVVGSASRPHLYEDPSEVVAISLRPRLNAFLLICQTDAIILDGNTTITKSFHGYLPC